jgi:hypothetical protein
MYRSTVCEEKEERETLSGLIGGNEI